MPRGTKEAVATYPYRRCRSFSPLCVALLAGRSDLLALSATGLATGPSLCPRFPPPTKVRLAPRPAWGTRYVDTLISREGIVAF